MMGNKLFNGGVTRSVLSLDGEKGSEAEKEVAKFYENKFGKPVFKLDRNIGSSITKKFPCFSEPLEHVRGRPDLLMLYNDKGPFIEVKVTGGLNKYQEKWISKFKDDFHIEIAHVKTEPMKIIAVPKEVLRELNIIKYEKGYDRVYQVIEELLGRKRRPTE